MSSIHEWNFSITMLGLEQNQCRSSSIRRFALGAVCVGVATIAILMSQAPAASDDPGVPILLYHRFHPTVPGSTTVTTQAFEEQIDWLAEHHYTAVPLSSVVAALRGGPALASRSVAITVDDGRRSQFTQMFPIILRYRMPVTLFVYTDAISLEPDALTWDEIEEMLESGLVDIQSHTCSHPDFKKERERRTAADYESFVASELARSRKTIEDRLKRPASFLAWPYGIVDTDLERAAALAGYNAAFAVEGRVARTGVDLFAVPRILVSDADRGARFEKLLGEGNGAYAGLDEQSAEQSAMCRAAHENADSP
jgi:peptidoglycan/xylan/chitin deacetylase (PgdA/CDA1 family)